MSRPGSASSAWRCARRAGRARPNAKPMSSPAWGSRWFYAGRTAAGLAAFDRAVQRSSGVLAARVLVRRGMMLFTLGRYQAALDDPGKRSRAAARRRPAVDGSRAERPRAAHLSVGSTSRADADFVSAGRLFSEWGRNWKRLRRSQPRADRLDVGRSPGCACLPRRGPPRYRLLNVPTTIAAPRPVRGAAGGRAGRRCAGRSGRRGAGNGAGPRPVPKKAELLLMAANCALAAAQPQAALDWAQAAYRLFRSQRSCLVAGSRGARARRCPLRGRPGVAALLREANRAAARLDALGSGDAAQAHLLAGRIGLELGRRDEAERHLHAAPGPTARPGYVTGRGLARRGAAGRGRGPSGPDAGRLPPGARRSGRAPVHPRRLRAPGAGHRARRRTSRARAAPCRASRPPAAPADLERTVAGHRRRSPRAAARRPGTERRPCRVAQCDQATGEARSQGRPRHCCGGNSGGWRPRCAPARCEPRERAVDGPRSARRTCSTNSARPS